MEGADTPTFSPSTAMRVGSRRSTSEERLTVLAAAVLVGLAAAWGAVAWRYLAQQRAELERAQVSAITLAESVLQDFIGVSQSLGLRAVLSGTVPPVATARTRARLAADNARHAFAVEGERCACQLPEPAIVGVVDLRALDAESSALVGSKLAGASYRDLRALLLRADRHDNDLVSVVTVVGEEPVVVHARYWDNDGARAATIAALSLRTIAERAFRPAVDSLLHRLLPLHAGRDSVIRVTVHTRDGRAVFASGGASARGRTEPSPTPSWSDSSSRRVEFPAQPVSFVGEDGGRHVLRARPFWTVARPSLVASVDVDVAALLYGIPGTPRPISSTAVRLSLAAVALLAVWALFALHRARRLMRARTLFFSGISHELRTPLTQVLLYGESLQEGHLSEEHRRRAQHIIVRETRRLVHMIENVLLLARGGAEHIPLNPVSTDVGEVVTDALQSLQLLLDRHRATVDLQLTPATALIDPGALRQVVVNLIDNALRYGPPGQCLTVRAVPHEHGVQLTIADEGPGIPAKDRRRVFLPFEKGNTATNTNGTGLGLALVKQLVTAMHGRVWIDDVPRPGCSITIWLPAPPALQSPIGRRA